MKITSLAAAALLCATMSWADATIQQHSQFHLAGPLGGIINAFSRTAREGADNTVVVHGNRKLSRTGDTGELIDLDQEKIYMIDFGRQTYSVKTFDEIRREMQEQQDRVKKSQGRDSKASKNEGPEYDVDFDVKSTGKRENVNGYDTHQEIVTVTVHEKGKPIEKSGGWILTSDIAMGPKVPAMREVADFERRFIQKLYGPGFAADMRSLAVAFATTPAFAKAMKTFYEKRASFDGTPIRTNMKFETIEGTEQPKEQAKSDERDSDQTAAAAVIGGFMNRMKQRKQEKSADSEKGSQAGRSELFTSTLLLNSAKASASAAEVAIPTNFRQR